MAKRQKTATITADTWPRHPDGRRKTIGEMTPTQQVAVARGAVARLTPEFAAIGVALKFKPDPWTRAADVHAAADHDRLFPRVR